MRNVLKSMQEKIRFFLHTYVLDDSKNERKSIKIGAKLNLSLLFLVEKSVPET